MKKVIRSVKLIVLILAGLSASGSNLIPNSEAVINGVDSISEVKTTKIIVRNANGKIIHQETVKNIELYLENFDLSILPEGSYLLEFEKDFEIEIKPFTVVYDQVVFDTGNTYSIFKPVITTNGKLVYLTRLSFDKKVLNVKVFDFDNNLIYYERLKGEVELSRIYDFSERLENKFKVVLNTEGRTFVQNIEF